ncbi:hypothetical protein C8J56DRAFT_1037725 [Mycena floridula]|nr:hypothetical protein C8J56DRAFT_1037725 [Mycena floridula]
MDLEKISIVEEDILDSPASPVPSSDDDDTSTTQMGDNAMRSPSPPALPVPTSIPAADSAAITPSSPEEHIYKLMDANLEQQKTIESIRRESRAALDVLKSDIEQLQVDTNKYRKDSKYWHNNHRSASPKRRRKESSTMSSSEDSRAPTCNKKIQNKIDLRLNPFSEDDLKHKIAYSYGQPPSSLVVQGVIKGLYAEAVSTAPHLQTPAMRCILKDGYVQTHHPSPIVEKTPITSTLPGMHYQLGGAKPGFVKDLPKTIPSPETIALIDASPAPKSLTYYMHETEAAAFFIYRARSDQLYIGCEVYQNPNHQWCISLRQVRGLLAAHATAPYVHGSRAYLLIYPYGRRFIEVFSNKLSGNDEEINSGPNHVYNHEWVSAKQDSDISVSSGIPTGYPGDPIYTTIKHVVPFADRGVNPTKGQTSAKSKNHRSGRAKTSGRIQSQVNQVTSQLNSVSFRKSVPAFIDHRYTPGFGGGVTYPPGPTFPPSGFGGQFMTPSTSAGPSVMSRASSSSSMDAVMSDMTEHNTSGMAFGDLIHDNAYGSDDGHVDVVYVTPLPDPANVIDAAHDSFAQLGRSDLGNA